MYFFGLYPYFQCFFFIVYIASKSEPWRSLRVTRRGRSEIIVDDFQRKDARRTRRSRTRRKSNRLTIEMRRCTVTVDRWMICRHADGFCATVCFAGISRLGSSTKCVRKKKLNGATTISSAYDDGQKSKTQKSNFCSAIFDSAATSVL